MSGAARQRHHEGVAQRWQRSRHARLAGPGLVSRSTATWCARADRLAPASFGSLAKTKAELAAMTADDDEGER